MDIEINNGMEQDQAYAVCISYWQEKLADRSKVSVDYDDTLSTIKGRALVKRLIAEGKIVYIVTRRRDDQLGPVYKAAADLKINKNRVIATNGKLKWETIKRLNIGTHYDNNKNEVDEINKNTDARGILFN